MGCASRAWERWWSPGTEHPKDALSLFTLPLEPSWLGLHWDWALRLGAQYGGWGELPLAWVGSSEEGDLIHLALESTDCSAGG